MHSAARIPWILIPGHMCDHRMWVGIRPSLFEAGIEVLNADLSKDDGLVDMAHRALGSLDRPAVIVGFSMGGMVALRMHAAAPDKVAGLALIDTNARPDLPERMQMRLEQQRRVRAGNLAEVVSGDMLPHYFCTSRGVDPAHAPLVEAMAGALGPDVFLRQSEAIRLRPDSRPDLAAIRCPTIVIGGLEDRLCAAEWQHDLASGIPGAARVLLPHVGHFAPLEEPGLVADALLTWAREHGLASYSPTRR